MNRPSIALIGAGQLGSRHLQGLLSASIPMHISVVDPASESHDLAAQRASAIGVPECVQVEYLYDMSRLPREIDVAIVATTAGPRRRVVEDLVAHARVRHLILEKVVFPRPDDFEPVMELLGQRETCAWVNLVRRCWPVYRRFAGALAHAPARMQVNGGAWGLGTSGIHFIDLFAMLGAQAPFSVDHHDLDRELAPSRHRELVEFTGCMTVRGGCGSTLTMAACAGRNDPVTVQVAGPGLDLMVAEGRRAWVIDHEHSPEPYEMPAESPFQSALTGELIVDLLRDGRCALPNLDLAAEEHRPFLAALIAHARACGRESGSAPVT